MTTGKKYTYVHLGREIHNMIGWEWYISIDLVTENILGERSVKKYEVLTT
jgi:hypothetical protein